MSEIEKELQMRIDAQRVHIQKLRERISEIEELFSDGVIVNYDSEQEALTMLSMTRSSIEVANHELARLITNLDRMRNAGRFNAR